MNDFLNSFWAHREIAIPAALALADALVGLLAKRFPAFAGMAAMLLPDVDGAIKKLLTPKPDESEGA
jgi:hypothetical protein